MNKLLILFCSIFTSSGFAAYSNYSSVMIGDRAAGMGGAFTALTGDPSAVVYYNPATIAQMKGHSLSASANVYHKYDSAYGEDASSSDATERVNQGAFRSIPSASGSILSYGHFAFGLSIIVPDNNYYIGQINNENDNISTLNLSDQSLWVGVGFGKNLTPNTAWGVSFYYTSLDAQYTSNDQSQINAGADTKLFNEERVYTNNALVTTLGGYHKFNDKWSIGLSYRGPSIEIAGQGSYFSTELDTSISNSATQTYEKSVQTDQKISSRIALGVSYTDLDKYTFAADVTHHAGGSHSDFEDASFARTTTYRPVTNLHLGAEKIINKYVKIRAGVFTNFSAHPEVSDSTSYEADSVDMWGFSLNAGIFTTEKNSFTFGGYYTGGDGFSKQTIDGSFQKVAVSKEIFSMLISSAYFF
ncbi:MAG: OmpP1/FadL family transporter [Bdellovibrionales bacterium]